MFVGTARAVLQLFETSSLKDKRRVVRSVLDRVRNRFRTSVAEVEEQDNHNLAVLGVAFISSNRILVEKLLREIESWIAANAEAELLQFQTEIMKFRGGEE